jgi:hypothetical protein
MSFSAFTAGILMVTNRDGNFAVDQDTAESTSDELVFYLKLKGTKVAKYTVNNKKREGTLVIGFQ